MQRYPYTDLVMVLALLTYVWIVMRVAGARRKYNVPAPNDNGPPEFQRAFRAAANTIEQVILFLPALWLFASAWGDTYAAAIGIFWPIGRIIYARGYSAAADKRGPGFGITFLCTLILLLGGLGGTIRNML